MRPHHVIFNRISPAQNFRLLTTRHSTHNSFLHISRQTGANTVAVHLVSKQTLWLKEHVVTFAISKSHHLVLKTGAIARTAFRIHLSAVHRCAMQILAYQRMNISCCLRDAAINLRQRRKLPSGRSTERHVTERHWRFITKLRHQRIPRQTSTPQSRRRSGLQSTEFKSKRAQHAGNSHRGSFADASAFGARLACMHEGAHKCSGRQYHCACVQFARFLRRAERAVHGLCHVVTSKIPFNGGFIHTHAPPSCGQSNACALRPTSAT